MSLTGPFFLDGIIVLTVVAFLALVLLWPRFTPQSPGYVLGRIGALALVNALVLLTAATQLNATYLFFSSWADLKGAVTGHLVVSSLDRGTDATRAASSPVRGRAAPVARNPVPLGQATGSNGLVTYTVHGTLSGLTGHVLVQLPPGYSSSGPNQRYPVLEAFHGYPGEPLDWIKVYRLRQDVEQLVRAHELRQPLIVMPQIEFPAGVDTEGVDGPSGQPQVETWLTRDVPDWLGRHFRVVANRSSWATIGLSAGGYDAAMAAVLHPAQYSAAIVLAGYYSPQFGRFYVPFTANSTLGERYDLSRVVAADAPAVALWVQTSHADKVSYRSSAGFLRATRPPMAVHAVILRNAGHRASVWIAMEPRALLWLGRNVPGFSTQPLVDAGACPSRVISCGGARRAEARARSAHALPHRGGRRPKRGAQ